MAGSSFGIIPNLLDGRYFDLQDVYGNVEPLPTLVPYGEYESNISVYLMDMNHDIFMSMLQEFTKKASHLFRAELWTFAVQWAMNPESSSKSNKAHPGQPAPKRPRLENKQPEDAEDSDDSEPPEPTVKFNQRILDPAIFREEDIIRILIDIVQINSGLLPNFVEFLYRWIDWLEGDGIALKAALQREIPSLWDFDFNPILLPKHDAGEDMDKDTHMKDGMHEPDGPGTKDRPSKLYANNEQATLLDPMEGSSRLQYREVRYGYQPPKMDEDIPPLINIPREQGPRIKYYAACFKSRQIAIYLLKGAGLTMQQIGNYVRSQKPHPRDCSKEGVIQELPGLKNYWKDAAMAQEWYRAKQHVFHMQEKQKEAALSTKLQLEAKVAAGDVPNERAAEALLPEKPFFISRWDMLAPREEEPKQEEFRITIVPHPLVGRLRSDVFRGATSDEIIARDLKETKKEVQRRADIINEKLKDDPVNPDSDNEEAQAPDPESASEPSSDSDTSDPDSDMEDIRNPSIANIPLFTPPSQLPSLEPPIPSIQTESFLQVPVTPQTPGLGAPSSAVPNPASLPSLSSLAVPPAGFNAGSIILTSMAPLPPLGVGAPSVPDESQSAPSPAGFGPPSSVYSPGHPTNAFTQTGASIAHGAAPPVNAYAQSMIGAVFNQALPLYASGPAGTLSAYSQATAPNAYTQAAPPNAYTPAPPNAYTQAAPNAYTQAISNGYAQAAPTNAYTQAESTNPISQGTPSHAHGAGASLSTNEQETELMEQMARDLLAKYHESQQELSASTAAASTAASSSTGSAAQQTSNHGSQGTSAATQGTSVATQGLPAAAQGATSSAPNQPGTEQPTDYRILMEATGTTSIFELSKFIEDRRAAGLPTDLESLRRLAPASKSQALQVPPQNPRHAHGSPYTSLKPTQGAQPMSLAVYFPQVVVPANGIGPNGGRFGNNGVVATDAFLLGTSIPGSGRIVFTRAIFLPAGVARNMQVRRMKGSWRVIETYFAQSSAQNAARAGGAYAHQHAYAKLVGAWSMMARFGDAREDVLTKRWRVSPGRMTARERGAVWEGYGCYVRAGEEKKMVMKRRHRVDAGRNSWLVDKGREMREGGMEEEMKEILEARRKEIEEMLEEDEMDGDGDDEMED